jgi:hypothetical protein
MNIEKFCKWLLKNTKEPNLYILRFITKESHDYINNIPKNVFSKN